MNEFGQVVSRLRDWMVTAAFPLWADAGFDQAHRRFHERLSFDGTPMAGPIRLLVQARQVYSFSVAARRGWHPQGRHLAETAFVSMKRDFHRPDGGEGWVFSIHPDGTPADTRRDLYAHAFVLLAVASYVELTGHREALDIAAETVSFLNARMRGPIGGFIEVLPAQEGVRRQNPHMHLLEGFLALWQVSREEMYLKLAADMVELFRRYFFRPRFGALSEYFEEGLTPAAGETGEIVEPGHHFEWIWLLRQYEAASGVSVQRHVDALYAHADRHGISSSSLPFDEVLSDGHVRTASHRLWPMTEAIKANAVEAAKGRPGAEEKVLKLVAAMFRSFLAADVPGGWIDRLDREGKPAAEFMPASSLYHLTCALDVLHTPASQA